MPRPTGLVRRTLKWLRPAHPAVGTPFLPRTLERRQCAGNMALFDCATAGVHTNLDVTFERRRSGGRHGLPQGSG